MDTTLRTLLVQSANNECTECHTVGKVEIHHKDRDRANNHPDNLVVLCKPCHWKKHPKGSRLRGGRQRNHRVIVMFEPDEYKAIKAQAGLVPVSRWIRAMALGQDVDAKTLTELLKASIAQAKAAK
jgi:hypothetical protein